LQYFDVAGNKLTGSIPSLSGLTALQVFDAYNNQLTEPIPSLSGLTALQNFDVSTNQLTGSIPSLSGLTALRNFWVYNNQLTGSIPSLSGLTALRSFYVSGNKLTGPVPAAPISLVTGGSNLCGNRLVSSGNPTIDTAWVTAQNPRAVAGGNWLACQNKVTLPWLMLLLAEPVSQPVNGTCGSASGGTFSTAPSTNLCSTGAASTMNGSGPWTWSCRGSNGGSDANCSAYSCSNAVGSWAGTLTGSLCGVPRTGTWTMTVNSFCYATFTVTFIQGGSLKPSFPVGNNGTASISCARCTSGSGTAALSYTFDSVSVGGTYSGCGSSFDYTGSKQ
jgi:hypothetical protein